MSKPSLLPWLLLGGGALWFLSRKAEAPARPDRHAPPPPPPAPPPGPAAPGPLPPIIYPGTGPWRQVRYLPVDASRFFVPSLDQVTNDEQGWMDIFGVPKDKGHIMTVTPAYSEPDQAVVLTVWFFDEDEDKIGGAVMVDDVDGLQFVVRYDMTTPEALEHLRQIEQMMSRLNQEAPYMVEVTPVTGGPPLAALPQSTTVEQLLEQIEEAVSIPDNANFEFRRKPEDQR